MTFIIWIQELLLCSFFDFTYIKSKYWLNVLYPWVWDNKMMLRLCFWLVSCSKSLQYLIFCFCCFLNKHFWRQPVILEKKSSLQIGNNNPFHAVFDRTNIKWLLKNCWKRNILWHTVTDFVAFAFLSHLNPSDRPKIL